MQLSDTVTNKKSIISFEAFRDRTLAKFPEDKFDFSEAVYFNNNNTPIKIFCKEHKVWFYRRPYHLDNRNCGCEQCSKEVHKKRRLTQDEYIQRAYEIHGDKYNFSETVYIKSDMPITAWCNIHKEYFTLTQASDLINRDSRGCPKCGIIARVASITSNTVEFISKAILIHKDTYDYSKVSYINNRIPVEITCKQHGVFNQKPDVHLSGSGCPHCANILKAKRFHNKPTSLYYVKIYKDNMVYYKIGITSKDIEIRFSPYATKNVEVEVLAIKNFTTGLEPYNIEQNILSKFKHLKVQEDVLAFYLGNGKYHSNGNSEVLIEDIWEHISEYF